MEPTQDFKKPNEERIADALEKIVLLLDRQNKTLNDIDLQLRKRK